MPNEELKKQNIQRVLEGGMRCFIKYGIEKTGKAQIVKESGVSSRSISRYFSDKEDFVLAVLKHNINIQFQNSKRMCDQVSKTSDTGVGKIRQLIEMMIICFMEDPNIYLLFAEAQLYICHNREQKNVVRDYIEHYCLLAHELQAFIEEGIRDGSIGESSNPYMDARVFCQALFGFIIQIATAKQMYDYPDSACKEITDHFIKRTLMAFR